MSDQAGGYTRAKESAMRGFHTTDPVSQKVLEAVREMLVHNLTQATKLGADEVLQVLRTHPDFIRDALGLESPCPSEDYTSVPLPRSRTVNVHFISGEKLPPASYIPDEDE